MTAHRLFVLLLICASMGLASCATTSYSNQSYRVESKPKHIDNLCHIFNEKPHWVEPAQTSYDKWGIPVELMMAIVRHESSFRGDARPLDRNGKRISSAYGYSQAIDGTWNIYQRENKKNLAKRTNFADAIDFVGWYGSKSLKGGEEVSPYDVNALYVFYHDGWGALPEDGSRELKSAVLDVAAKVYKKTLIYHRQLKTCPKVADALYSKSDSSSAWVRESTSKGGGNKPRKKSGTKNNNKQWF